MNEAQEFWKDKVQMRPKDFKALADEAKVKAFAVSGIARGDQLNTVFTTLQRAIDEGTSFDQFKKECGDIFERRGWTGKRAWRVDNIFRTNIQTAYNVGRYKQLNEDVDVLPYWMYSAVNDSRTRPEHLAMNGRTWPANHPVWNTWYPPNGYRCRCSVIALTESQVKKRGVKIEEQDPTGRLIEPVHHETGARMPAKQLLPDPGFERNPGKDYWGDLGASMQEKLTAYPALLATAVLKKMVDSQEFERFLDKPAGDFPVLRLNEEAAQAIQASGRVAVFSKESLEKNLKHHPELSADDYRQLPTLGSDPDLIVQDSGQTVVLVRKGDKWLRAVVKATESGKGLYVTSLRMTNDSDVRVLRKKGEVLYEKK